MTANENSEKIRTLKIYISDLRIERKDLSAYDARRGEISDSINRAKAAIKELS